MINLLMEMDIQIFDEKSICGMLTFNKSNNQNKSSINKLYK